MAEKDEFILLNLYFILSEDNMGEAIRSGYWYA